MKNIEILDEQKTIHEVVVVAFDMCSSSKMIEDLTRTNSLIQYERMLRNLRAWLVANAKSWGFVLYKFTGDGWLLMFPAEKCKGEKLIFFLLRLCIKHEHYRRTFLEKHLESIPEYLGLTLGVDSGKIREIRFENAIEFVGRAINVACRLQSVVGDKRPGPDYRCLMSRKVYNSYMRQADVSPNEFIAVSRTLRNISGGEKYQCYKIDFSRNM